LVGARSDAEKRRQIEVRLSPTPCEAVTIASTETETAMRARGEISTEKGI